MSDFPQLFRVRQSFPRPREDDLEGAVERQLNQLHLDRSIQPGQSVAVTAGSRGITNIGEIVRAIVAFLRGLGAEPFLVPAMGSHGGATADGQRKVLEAYGVTEAFCGCPIRSSMETVVVCRSVEGFPVHFDHLAFAADHVLVCGRVKPHTQFSGPIGSGLLKMLLIGLGKHAGAKVYHAAFQDFSFDRIVRSVAERVIRECHVVGGVAILENAYDETARIVGVPPERFASQEPELLKLATDWMPRLPFRQADVLVIDEIGKDISGAGMDTNVIGRKEGSDEPVGDEPISIKRIVARSLTRGSGGNAVGIGIADVCTRRLADAIDRRKTVINAVTAAHFGAAKIPPVLETDRQALEMVLQTIGLTPPADARLLWIRNTLDLEEVECSAAYLDQARARGDLEILSGLHQLPLDERGNLPPTVAHFM
ncbi:MAG: lactate racemase domain-containing protein [Pirellulales bacterium]